MKILLVDDEPRNLLVLEGCLDGLGHRLIRANSGREAIAALDAEPPDLILLDLAMPEIDGIDVLTHVRARTDIPHTPVILITAHAEREHRLRALEAGADEFLEKPIDRAILLARVRLLLRLRAADEDIRRRQAHLERLQAEQRELTAFIVHDLKNPITVASVNIEFAVRSDMMDDLVRASLNDASEAVARVSSMVDDLLTISRLDAAELSLQREVISVSEVLAGVARAHGRELQEKQITLTLESVDEGLISGDPRIVRRMFENVVENAVRHTPRSGRIEIATRARDSVEICVANSGAPIASEDRNRIFERGQRGSGEPKGGRNLGLGLYFCRRAAEVHGGGVDLADSEGFAVSFVIRLPAA